EIPVAVQGNDLAPGGEQPSRNRLNYDAAGTAVYEKTQTAKGDWHRSFHGELHVWRTPLILFGVSGTWFAGASDAKRIRGRREQVMLRSAVGGSGRWSLLPLKPDRGW